MIRRECGRCGAQVPVDTHRHFCGEPYPLKATDDIRTVRYVPLAEVVARLRKQAAYFLEGSATYGRYMNMADTIEREFGSGER